MRRVGWLQQTGGRPSKNRRINMRFVFLFITMFYLSSAIGQNSFEIEAKPMFGGDSVTWVILSDNIQINLGTGIASFIVEGVTIVATDTAGVHLFKTLVRKRIEVNYSGQSITKTAQKNLAAAKFDLVYTGPSQ